MNSVKIKRKRPKRSEIMVGGIYACKHPSFSTKIEIEVTKVLEESVICKIVSCDPTDEQLEKDLLGITVVNFKNIWWTVQEPPKTESQKVEVKVTNPRKIGDKTKIKSILVHFSDGRVQKYNTAREVDLSLGYKKGFVYRTLNRYQKTKKHGVVYVEYEDSGRTEPLDFIKNNPQKGAIHVFRENGEVIAEGTIAELARETGYSKHMINWFKYHGTNPKVVKKEG